MLRHIFPQNQFKSLDKLNVLQRLLYTRRFPLEIRIRIRLLIWAWGVRRWRWRAPDGESELIARRFRRGVFALGGRLKGWWDIYVRREELRSRSLWPARAIRSSSVLCVGFSRSINAQVPEWTSLWRNGSRACASVLKWFALASRCAGQSIS